MLNLARDAIRNGLIEPHYQPQIDLRGGQPIGFEALLRLRYPELGIQLPATRVASDSSRLPGTGSAGGLGTRRLGACSWGARN